MLFFFEEVVAWMRRRSAQAKKSLVGSLSMGVVVVVSVAACAQMTSPLKVSCCERLPALASRIFQMGFFCPLLRMDGTGNANVWFGCCFRDFVTFSTFDWGGGKKKEEKETKQIVCMWHISSSLVKFSRPSLHQSVPPTPPRPAAPPPSSSSKSTRGGVSRRGWSGGWSCGVGGSGGGHTRGEYLGFLGTSVKDFSS